jgi:hypothetical protein
LTAFEDKAFFPSLFATATTDEGKVLWRGENTYPELASSTPTACVTGILTSVKPMVQTHACPRQKTARMCLQQPDTQ